MRGGSFTKCGLAGAVDDFEGSNRVNFPSGGAPVAGTVWGGVDGLRFVLGIEKEPAADADPASLEMVAESAGGPVLAALLRKGATARSHFHDDPTIFRTVHGVEHKLDVRVAVGRIRGAAIDGFDAADLYIPDIAGDFRSAAIVPAAAVIAGFQHRGKGCARVELLELRRGVSIFKEI